MQSKTEAPLPMHLSPRGGAMTRKWWRVMPGYRHVPGMRRIHEFDGAPGP